MARGFFVTGTDTGVGKSVVTAALATAAVAHGHRVGVMKPLETGVADGMACAPGTDAAFLRSAAGAADDPGLICPYALPLPAAPAVAAQAAGVTIETGVIMAAFRTLTERYDFVLVEGAGGLAVPVTPTCLMSDLAVAMGMPVLVVARPTLGTINHTVLSVKFAQECGLTVCGVIFSNYPADPDIITRTNGDLIEQWAQVPVLGIVGRDPDVDVGAGRMGQTAQALAGSPLILKLFSS